MPSLTYKLSEYAEKDLAGIFDYTLQTWGEEQFRRYRDKLQEALDEICKNPLSVRSKSRDELFKGCRSFSAGKHVILYRVKEVRVEIARVLHQSMDLERHIPSEYRERPNLS